MVFRAVRPVAICICLLCVLEVMITAQLRRSQVRRSPSLSEAVPGTVPEEIDPRVGSFSTQDPGAASAVKLSGKGGNTAAPWSAARKRARGKWYTATESVAHSHRLEMPARRPEAIRLRVMTYNIGGICATTYDVFCEWLLKQGKADIIVLQELHHGCGKQENRWKIGPWTALISPDAKSRYSGVGVFVHSRVCSYQVGSYMCVAKGCVRMLMSSQDINMCGRNRTERKSRNAEVSFGRSWDIILLVATSSKGPRSVTKRCLRAKVQGVILMVLDAISGTKCTLAS